MGSNVPHGRFDRAHKPVSDVWFVRKSAFLYPSIVSSAA
jgi:hypothetical protein